MATPLTGRLDLELAIELTARQADQLFARTGKSRFRHIAADLRGQRKGGRPPSADAEALAIVRRLITAGRRPWTACMIAARDTRESAKVESVARRLFGKIPTKPVS